MTDGSLANPLMHIENVLCLVFLEHQLADLANRYAEDKVINALQKSWAKMSESARAEALKISLSDREKALIQIALD